MDQLRELVNKLQQVCTSLGDNAGNSRDDNLPSLWEVLPSIVVIGGQSSGKSSVLEAVVGKDFLPRGSGIVTRRPLLLQLVQSKAGAKEYGEFLHKMGEKFTQFDAIRQEIEAETHRSLGSGKAVSPDPIHLTIHSPDVPNLTLVDMPGLTKIATEGQPKSIVKDIEDMARAYIKGENAIILAVSPANADMATSDGLRLAREVDPAGERTIGVLTKLDIMDRGTNARDVLEGRSVQLKHGWIAVVNRAQADINSKMTMEECRKKEMEFFNGSPHYRGLRNVGMSSLTHKLCRKLEEAIVRQIPKIQQTINKGVQDMQKELKALGPMTANNRGAMVHEILSMCREFDSSYATMLDGGKGGGEAILDVFEGKLTKHIRELPFKQVYSLSNIKKVINEADGYQPHLIAPEMGYRRLIEAGLKLLKDPSVICVEEVYLILQQLVQTVLGSKDCEGLSRYSLLSTEILAQSGLALERMRDEAKSMVMTMVDMEASYLTAEFFREILRAQDAEEGMQGLKTFSGRNIKPGSDGGTSEDLHMKQIANHVSAYLGVVCNQLKATIPKAIVHCLVLQAKKSLLDKFVEEVAGKDAESLRRLLGENEEVMQRREVCSKRLEMLQTAYRELTVSLSSR
ncbi:dynamin-related GTPase [Chloropicon primus]|uniref:Dynamin-related GTPase n=1 Tax=Chloropicon primus TaxID=1764295 RepID=A0A5B8N172_9CHLO|nr:dynamin-related GTPase [Chloropicon primus]UPR04680.1 dynamin-related GTPase [Chloropicon primus]|mmetsp:Transcript_3100/g.8469  ORF Transcript_3100/g.8469 Transcript_3100/m.8469 type:complete len:627 (-) Transcript_3100:3165-5045(-)|eukprot:QDZ25484.1 dynamin-related GTPase [Chloropicon primus]